ncbi:hypothetical protein MRB53_016289 [Persea americana]|uniref:Uncharacterized protein n=1 Tax=Persea americana TaxID=3435 RepID=A0ACC2M1R0_PERAE|nr:hypothetical protein MRB53_016289 [Persea americana]
MGSIHIFHFFSQLLLSSLGVGFCDGDSGFCGGDSGKPQLTEHGPEIKFPFRIKEQQPPHCGYPGFDISYQDNATFIHIPSMNRDFIVKQIDYKQQMMAVTPNRNDCFWRLFLSNSSSISFSPFVLERSYNYTFISCANNVMDIHSDRPISCLSDSEHDVFMVPRCWVWSEVGCTRLQGVQMEGKGMWFRERKQQ